MQSRIGDRSRKDNYCKIMKGHHLAVAYKYGVGVGGGDLPLWTGTCADPQQGCCCGCCVAVFVVGVVGVEAVI